jgi:hypothetical protein
MVLNATFKNMSAISRWSFFFLVETGVEISFNILNTSFRGLKINQFPWIDEFVEFHPS